MKLFRSLLMLILGGALSASGLRADAVPPVRSFVFIPLAANDFNFSQSAYEGYERLSKDGYRIGYQDNVDSLLLSKVADIIDRNYAEGVSAFIFVGAELSDLATQAAAKYPKAYFATLAGNARGSNVINYCLDCLSSGGDLGGKVALDLSKTRIMGFVGGVAAIDGSEASKFRQTILAADPKAQVLIDWTENWSDLEGAAKLTEEQIRKGADVVYATANMGVITAADKYPSVKIIGALVDVSSLSKNVAASVVINTDVVYRHFIRSIADGTFRSGVYNASAADGVWSVVGRKSP